MVFSSLAFLFLFLPSLNLTYLICLKRIKWQNFILMVFSLSFYYWGEKDHIFIMLGCIFVNYLCGIFIEESKNPRQRTMYLITSITASLALLIYFKYFNFFLNTMSDAFNLNLSGFKRIALPLGISFYTFHALSYVIDVYWKKVNAERNFVTFVCYVSFFPQLVAGPIVRYIDIKHSFYYRYITRAGVRNGILRFCFGLAKKVLIANEVAKLADYVFYLPPGDLTFATAWLGAIAYALQIYFDFSGYSDMAIGLGLMFGFKYKENFNFPYGSLSIQEFWRKWHISLSSWFRDYIYIPLGGSYKSDIRTKLNLIIIFTLCGLWHGANYTFVLWGLYHGVFLILERTGFGKFMARLPHVIRHVYVLFVVTIGWVFFREEHLDSALSFIKTMLIPGDLNVSGLSNCVNILTVCAMSMGTILALGANRSIKDYLITHRDRTQIIAYKQLSSILGLSVLLISILFLSTNSYNPFLYFRF
ncbi:alginate O-acetylation protein [Legionella moravica]|uniref:Probable alginate O-acetylase n=1 Tax=Legionella moravica TaxID=39962 RepID=A0A378JU57_9GAMM|nr:MBOAT family O-acyltransferase [Legionella moravica]KTD35392.1 alginate O-acetylation protein [Legionella moravica]STX61976.1 alginate O-acetylation protein [Legionella moravica]